MTRMLPSTIHSTVRSGAERRVFKLIRDAPDTETWVCLHSLALAHHEYKRHAEIDFLLLTPFGCFVLEVKGGRVRREDGHWSFTDRYDKVTRKRESPFQQASSAMFSLERSLRSGLPDLEIPRILFGYGVMFPDIEYPGVGADEDPSLVYDLRDRREPFRRYIDRLARFTREAQPQPRRAPTRREIDVLAEHLRGDFDLVPEINVTLDDARNEAARLTAEQFAVLDAAAQEPRLIIDGPAGSGKTLLALESARRHARQGERVLLLCYNRLLASHLESLIQDEQYSGEVRVRTLHAHFSATIRESSLREEFDERTKHADGQELYRELIPEYGGLAAMESAAAPWDVIVIDEAQDVLTESHLDALDQMLRGGIENGRWLVFLDSNNQASVYGQCDRRLLDRLKQLGAVFVLTANCRNTAPIAFQTNVVAAPERRSVARREGPPVRFSTYRSEADGWDRLEAVLHELRTSHTQPGRISVLLAHAPQDGDQQRLEALGNSSTRRSGSLAPWNA